MGMPANMINWAARIDVIDVYVEDVESTKSFYERVFGLPATYHPDCVDFVFGDTILHLRDVSTAADFIAPARAADRRDGSRGLFTIFVADLDRVCPELAKRGARLLNGPAGRRSGARSVCFADPAGQVWEVAEDRVQARPRSTRAGGYGWADTEMRIGQVVLFARDLPRALSFYRDAFSLAAERLNDGAAWFPFEGMSVGLLDVPGARELIAPAEVAGSNAGLRFTFCTFVDDVDAACAHLAARGIPLFRNLIDLSFGHRLASLRDPAGHIWELVGEVARES